MERRRAVLVSLAVVVAVAGGWWGWQGLQTPAPTAPDFTLVDTGYEDGVDRGPKVLNLTDFRGKTVVLDFMAYNCAACRVVTPNIMDPLHERYGAREDFVLLTIDVGEFSNFPGSNHENLVKWQTEEYGSPWRHALDEEGIFLDYVRLGAIGLPSVFIIDGDGTIVHRGTGIPDLQNLERVIDASLAHEAGGQEILAVGIIGLAFVAGVVSFFAPCSVGLLPAYLGLLLRRQGDSHRGVLSAAMATSLGIVSLYAVLAVILWLARDALAPVIPWMGPVVGGAFILLGLLLLIGIDWERIATRLGLGNIDGRNGFLAFGFGYGLAAFGCTGPIFLPVLIAGFAQSRLVGLGSMAAYTIAVSLFVLFAAYLVHAGRQTQLRRILSHTTAITRISAVLLIGAGAYLVWFDVNAFAAV